VTRVKICGLQRVEDALAATEAGADYLGFVFWPSRRYVEPSRAREIIAAVHAQSSGRAVGVFVDEDPAEMNRLARLCALDYIQLSGSEPEELVASLAVPAIKVFHVQRGGGIDQQLVEQVVASSAELVLLDSAHKNLPGGTGATFDWSRLPPFERRVMLAGGLHAGNVGKAIKTFGPWGVDVSSGVETDGRKDQEKIQEFIKLAKNAEVRLRSNA
jgi:phosphoribosylanthranilate isomerase